MQPVRVPGEIMAAIDPLELRQAFGTFMTGVTVITTRGTDGSPRGFTANSFTSVSLDPPLLLVCIGKGAASLDSFIAADGFAVSILAETQKKASGIFASKRPDKFAAVGWHADRPEIPSSTARSVGSTAPATTSSIRRPIVVMAASGFAYSDANPLGIRARLCALGLEQAAVNALSRAPAPWSAPYSKVDGGLLLMKDAKTGGLTSPRSAATGTREAPPCSTASSPRRHRDRSRFPLRRLRKP